MESVDIHPSATAIKTTLLGIVVSVVLIFVKGIAGYLGHSYALIADATESGADILSSGLLWLGLRIAIKAPDEQHPYGHGKAEPLAAIVVALFLVQPQYGLVLIPLLLSALLMSYHKPLL